MKFTCVIPFSFRNAVRTFISVILASILFAYFTWDYFSAWNMVLAIGAVFLVLFFTALIAVVAQECRTSPLLGWITAKGLYLMTGILAYIFAANTFSAAAFAKAKVYPAKAAPFIE